MMNILTYAKEKPINAALGVVFIVSIGLITFFYITERSENRLLKKQNKSLRADNEKLQYANDSINSEIVKRDEVIKQSTVVYDSLKTTLAELNKKNIVTNYESYSKVTSLNLSQQIELLNTYLTKAQE